MSNGEREKYIIEQYQNDEEMMILIFAQWCVNNGFDARALYKKAYPTQVENKALFTAMEKTVPKESSEEIPLNLVIEVLQLFGNDDLAFVVQHTAEKTNRSENR